MKKAILFIFIVMLFISLKSFSQNIIQVTAGTDVISAAYSTASAGDIIELISNGGLYVETSTLTVTADKAITIRSKAGLRYQPVWVCSAVSDYGGIIKTNGGITVDGIIMDGTGGTPPTATVNGIITGGNSYSIKVYNSTFKNFTTALYGESGTVQVDSIVFKGCLFENISGNAIMCYGGTTPPADFKYLSLTNSTFWNPVYRSVACLYTIANDALYSPNAGWTPDPRVEIDHVTVYNFRRLYCKEHSNVQVKNTIFMIPTLTSSTGFILYGDQTSISNCMYYNVSNSFTNGVVETNLLNADPLFPDAPNGDLTITETSPAYHAGTDGKSLGDPRWWPEPQFTQKIIKIAAGTDSIAKAYASASSGDIIELITDGGLYIETAMLTVTDKQITIRAKSGLVTKPIWACTAASDYGGLMEVYASVTVDGIIMDGTGSTPATVNGIITKGTAGDYNITVKNSTFKNFATAIYGSSGAQVDSVTISNCIFQDLSKYGIIIYTSNASIPGPGCAKHITISNSTFSNIATMAIQVEANDYVLGTALGDDPVVTIDHVTFYNTPRVYTHYCNFTTIRNCIFSTGTNSYYIYGNQTTCQNSLYWNAPPSFHTAATTNIINADPLFANAANGDFTLLPGSPAYNSGTDGKSLGDPRWWPVPITQKTIRIAAGTDSIATAYASANSGDIIELITDGGLYIETAMLTVTDKPITIRAKSGLVNKPIWACTAASDYGGLMEVYANVYVDGIIMDGTGSTPATVNGIITKGTAGDYNITVKNSTFKNFATAIYGSSGAQVDSVTISNCIFQDLSKYGIIIYTSNASIPGPGCAKHITISNSTFSNIATMAIQVEANDYVLGTALGDDPVVTIDHVTFYNTPRVYTHYCNFTTIRNCIFSTGTNSYYIYGNQTTCQNSLYWNAPPSFHTAATTNIINADPMFANAVNGDFTLLPGSPAYKSGTDGKSLGDPRWWPKNTLPTNIHWGSTNNTLNGLTITWNNLALDDSLRWGYTNSYEMGTFPGIRRDNYKTGSDPQYLFDYSFPTLKPSSVLFYSLKSGGFWGAEKTFTTAVDTTSNKFTFIAAADCQAGTTIFQKISNMAAAEKADIYLQVGDIIDDSMDPLLWRQFYDYGSNFLENTLNYYIPTNHVYYDTQSGINFLNQFVLPGNEKWYSFKQGNTLFIGLNSQDELMTQLPYIKDLLKNTDATWIIVYFHSPFFTSGGHAGEMDSMIPYWWKTFDDYGVNVIINGHDHTYTRSKPMNLNASFAAPVNEYGCEPGQGRLQMLAGSFGAARYDYQTGWWVNTTKSVYDYVKFKVDGNYMHFDAIDVDNNIVDSLTFYSSGVRSKTVLPGFYFIAPGNTSDSTSYNYTIKWIDVAEPSDSATARVDLYFTTDTAQAGTLIAGSIKITDPLNYYLWDVKNITPGIYHIYAVIYDGEITPFKKYAIGNVVVIPDIVAPPPATDLKGTLSNGKVDLTWKNPTRNIPLEKQVASFEDGLDGFEGSGSGTSTGSLVQINPGYVGKGMQINYNITAAWDEYAAIKGIHEYSEYHLFKNLDFWYKGDGSNRAIRIIVEQDNDHNGKSDDWWYAEDQDLSSTEWKHAQLDLSTLQGLSWHANKNPKFDFKNIFSLDFIVPSESAGSGNLSIDEVSLSGEIPPAPDFMGVVILRKTDGYPANAHDGVLIYQGNGESCIDTTAESSDSFYYAVFAYDYAGNYSILDSTSVLEITGFTAVPDSKIPVRYELNQNYPNPFKATTKITYTLPVTGKVVLKVYNVFGKEVRTLINEEQKAGNYDVNLIASSLPDGIYYYRMQAGSYVKTRKMILAK